MRNRLSSRFTAGAILAAGLLTCPISVLAQEQAREGAYEVTIAWQLTRDGSEVEIVDVAEKPSGDVAIFRDPSRPLKIQASLLSPGTVELRLRKVYLTVRDREPFSIVGHSTHAEGDEVSNVQLTVSIMRTHTVGINESITVAGATVTQSSTTESVSGEAKIRFSSHVCPDDSATGVGCGDT